MKARFLLGALLLLVCSLTGCSDDENGNTPDRSALKRPIMK